MVSAMPGCSPLFASTSISSASRATPRRHVEHLRPHPDVAPAGAQADGHPLGAVALVDRDELAGDDETRRDPGGRPTPRSAGSPRSRISVTSLSAIASATWSADLCSCAGAAAACWRPASRRSCRSGPGRAGPRPASTAKFWTTTTCGRGSGAAVSSWLELCVQAASMARLAAATACFVRRIIPYSLAMAPVFSWRRAIIELARAPEAG